MIVNPCDPFDPSGFLQWVLVLCCSHGCVKLLLISVILLTGQYFCPGLLHCPWCRCCIRCQRSVQDNRSHQIPWNRCVFIAKEVFKTTGVIRYLGTGVYCSWYNCWQVPGVLRYLGIGVYCRLSSDTLGVYITTVLTYYRGYDSSCTGV